jgi:hypothetical protein
LLHVPGSSSRVIRNDSVACAPAWLFSGAGPVLKSLAGCGDSIAPPIEKWQRPPLGQVPAALSHLVGLSHPGRELVMRALGMWHYEADVLAHPELPPLRDLKVLAMAPSAPSNAASDEAYRLLVARLALLAAALGRTAALPLLNCTLPWCVHALLLDCSPQCDASLPATLAATRLQRRAVLRVRCPGDELCCLWVPPDGCSMRSLLHPPDVDRLLEEWQGREATAVASVSQLILPATGEGAAWSAVPWAASAAAGGAATASTAAAARFAGVPVLLVGDGELPHALAGLSAAQIQVLSSFECGRHLGSQAAAPASAAGPHTPEERVRARAAPPAVVDIADLEAPGALEQHAQRTAPGGKEIILTVVNAGYLALAANFVLAAKVMLALCTACVAPDA